MSIFSKSLNTVYYQIISIISKYRWGVSLAVEGLFLKKPSTQIIIADGGKMYIKHNVSFQRNVSLTAIAGGKLRIGSNVAFNRNCIVVCRKEIIIGDNVMFGPGVTIYDHDHIFSYDGILPGFKYGTITIEKGCWIAANVTILRGTHIGKGSVIGAGAIVKGNIPPHSLVTSDRSLLVVPIKTSIKSVYHKEK